MSFGCSFTEGGGLNSPSHHFYLNSNYTNNTEFLNWYMTENSYPAQLANLMDCSYENFGISRGANELIFKMLYENTKNTSSDVLITVQTSILSRILLYSLDTDKFETVNGLEHNPSQSITDYYEMYVKYFFNRNIEYQKLLQSIEVYTEYFKNRNVDIVWIIGESDNGFVKTSKYIVSFENKDLHNYADNYKLRLRHLPNYPTDDSHFSENGNKIIAEKILEHLKEYHGY